MVYIVDMSSGLSLVVPISILVDILVVSKAPLVIYIVDVLWSLTSGSHIYNIDILVVSRAPLVVYIVDMSSGLSLVVSISIL